MNTYELIIQRWLLCVIVDHFMFSALLTAPAPYMIGKHTMPRLHTVNKLIIFDKTLSSIAYVDSFILSQALVRFLFHTKLFDN